MVKVQLVVCVDISEIEKKLPKSTIIEADRFVYLL